MTSLDEIKAYLKQYRAYLETDTNNPNWLFTDTPSNLSPEAKKTLVDEESSLYGDIAQMMMDKQPTAVLRWLVGYFHSYFLLCNMGKEERHIDGSDIESVLSCIDIFLQNVSDMAYGMGVDASMVEAITQKHPHGCGGVDHRRVDVMGEKTCTRMAPDQNGVNVLNSKKSNRGKGRPKEDFKNKMIDDADGNKLKKIHAVMKGKKGKDACLIILACILKGWITRPTFTQVENEFGNIGNKTTFNKYLEKRKFTNEEIEGAKNSLNL